jgi:hypothetical protein
VAFATASSKDRIGGAAGTAATDGGATPACGGEVCGCGGLLSQPATSVQSNALLTVRREIGAILAMEGFSKPGFER